MFMRLALKAWVWKADARTRLVEDRGATAVEYALMLALIFMVIFGAVVFLGTSTNAQFENVGDCFPPSTCS